MLGIVQLGTFQLGQGYAPIVPALPAEPGPLELVGSYSSALALSGSQSGDLPVAGSYSADMNEIGTVD